MRRAVDYAFVVSAVALPTALALERTGTWLPASKTALLVCCLLFPVALFAEIVRCGTGNR